MGEDYRIWHTDDTLYIKPIVHNLRPKAQLTQKEIDFLLEKWEPVLRRLENHESTWNKEIRW